jgi:hypothetical protein
MKKVSKDNFLLEEALKSFFFRVIHRLLNVCFKKAKAEKIAHFYDQ